MKKGNTIGAAGYPDDEFLTRSEERVFFYEG